MTTRHALLGAVLLATAGISFAQSSGGPFTLTVQRIASGGGRSAAGPYVLEGTIGQHEAGPVLAGGAFEHSGGYHRRSGAVAPGNAIFADGFEGP